MNRFVISFLSCALALVGACGGKQQEAPAASPLSVTPAGAEVIALGETKAFSVTSSTDWYARSDQSWAKLPTAAGKGSSDASTLYVNVEENKTTEQRIAKITVSNLGKESQVITITQAASEGVAVERGISTAEDLVNFAKAVNGEGPIALYLVDGVVKILKDIDCSSIKEWVPAGTEENPLTYSIAGDGHALKNVNWKVDVEKYPSAGLIGAAKGVKIEKLTFGSVGSQVEFTGNAGGKVRAGGIVGRAENVTMERVTVNASLTVSGTTATGRNLIIGGLAGYSDNYSTIGGELLSTKGCTVNGNVTAPVACHAGGLVGYNSGKIQNCTFKGKVSCPLSGDYGPGWLCSYGNPAAISDVKENYGYGFVGETASAMRNSMINCETGYDIETNTVDWTQDSYYDWKEVESLQLHSGAKWYHYECINVPRHIHVLEIDLSNPGIEVTQAFAGEIVPNPNGNANDNNGFKLRERLSDVCARRRSEGQKILAGVNSCFFNSNDGFPRGHVVEEGEPIFINNPKVASDLTNHKWALTVFTDRTASCGVKQFSGKIRRSAKEYTYCSINDTILRHSPQAYKENEKYQANLFTSRYVRTPYASKPNIINPLADNVLYVICEYSGSPMKVNTGYAPAKVVKVLDGRSSRIAESALPYFTQKNRVGISLSGAMATEWEAVKVGDELELRCDISIDGDASKPIYTLNSTMYQLMTNGADASNTPGSSASLYTAYDPKTFPVVSADRSKLWLVEIDGRQIPAGKWYSLGVKSYEMYRIGKKLGGAWITGMDGGGSSCIWVWNQSKGSGSIVSHPCDSRGERSCMTYVLIREK